MQPLVTSAEKTHPPGTATQKRKTFLVADHIAKTLKNKEYRTKDPHRMLFLPTEGNGRSTKNIFKHLQIYDHMGNGLLK